MAEQFYVQDTRGFVGNSMLWWKHDNCGYVCDIREAKVFTQVELEKIHSLKEGTKRAWPKQYIDERVAHHIDMQHCEIEEALAEANNV